MRKLVSIMLGLALLLTGCSGLGSSATTQVQYSDEASVEVVQRLSSVAPSNVSLGLEVLKASYEEAPESNHLFSPISASFALAMLQNGAEGATKDEMMTLLGNAEDCNQQYRRVLEKLEDRNGEELKVKLANSLWMSKEWTPNQSFVDTLGNVYEAEVFSSDFTDEKLPSEMNQWIEDKTEGMIKDAIDEFGSNDEEMLAVLMNTLYFKGQWDEPFRGDSTYKDTFYEEDGDEQTVEMMHASSYMKYQENNLCQTVHLEYNGNMEMVIL